MIRSALRSKRKAKNKRKSAHFDQKLDMTFRILPRYRRICSLNEITLDDVATLPRLGISRRNFSSQSNVDVLSGRQSERLL